MEDEFNALLDEQWARHFAESSDVLSPYYFDTLKKDALLFVGFNPSFSAKKMRKRLTEKGVPESDSNDYFAWKNNAQFDRQLAIQLGRDSRGRTGTDCHPFYRSHHRVSGNLDNCEWEHLDLYRYFRTNQKEMLGILSVQPAFASDQLTLFRRALEHATPKVVVVLNAEASTTIKQLLKPRFDEAVGWHSMDLEYGSVPTFFSSMLTGQRALDIHSRERLEWHIKVAWQSTQLS